ncbi:MAG: ssl1498 family light-harvesting-like protein [Cyanobacteria bacterium P01_F01_bin.42]
MRYTEDDSGLLNNFAVEPQMYTAEPPSKKQKKTYMILGAVSGVLLVGLLAVAVTVS